MNRTFRGRGVGFSVRNVTPATMAKLRKIRTCEAVLLSSPRRVARKLSRSFSVPSPESVVTSAILHQVRFHSGSHSTSEHHSKSARLCPSCVLAPLKMNRFSAAGSTQLPRRSVSVRRPDDLCSNPGRSLWLALVLGFALREKLCRGQHRRERCGQEPELPPPVQHGRIAHQREPRKTKQQVTQNTCSEDCPISTSGRIASGFNALRNDQQRRHRREIEQPQRPQVPLVEKKFVAPSSQPVRNQPPHYKRTPQRSPPPGSPPSRPRLDRQIVLGPTHAQPDSRDPQKLPGPQIERSHFVQRNSRRDVVHHESMFGSAKSKLRQHPERERLHRIGFHPMRRASRITADDIARKIMYIGKMSSSGGR